MADFTDLPVNDGVGNWHFNRFRIAFEPQSAPAALFANLLARFPTYINSKYATAEWGSTQYNNHRTVHFHGYAKYIGIDVGQPHTDWVAIMESNAVSFTVQTLKREFWDTKEDLETSVGILATFRRKISSTDSAISRPQTPSSCTTVRIHPRSA